MMNDDLKNSNSYPDPEDENDQTEETEETDNGDEQNTEDDDTTKL